MTPTDPADPDGLPTDIAARLRDALGGEAVRAHAAFDLGEDGRFGHRHAVVTDRHLLIVNGGPEPQPIDLADVAEARVVEGVGLDRLLVTRDDGPPAADLPYSRAKRRDVLRLHRVLQRRIDVLHGKKSDGVDPAKADQIDRAADAAARAASADPGDAPMATDKAVLWRLLEIARPYRSLVWLTLALTLVMSLLAVLPGIFLKYLFDTAIAPPEGDEGQVLLSGSERLRNLALWSGLTLAAVLAIQGCLFFRLRMLMRIGSKVSDDLRQRVYAHLHSLSLRYFGKRRVGSLITRVTSDTDRLWDFIVFGSVDLIRDVLVIGVIAAVMFYLNWRLAIAALVPLPPLAILTYYRSVKMQRMFTRLWTYWSRLTAVVGDALPGVKVVKAFANEPREVNRFMERSHEFGVREEAVNRVWAGLRPIIGGTMGVGRLLVWVAGGYLAITRPKTVTLGDLIAFSAFVNGFYEPIMELANSNRIVARAATSAQRVFEVLDTPPEIVDKPDAYRPAKMKGRVEFRDVSFSYEGAKPALRDIDLTVEPGQMIGLAGPSGAGKSTFVNLMCRFYDVTDGAILIDGVDVRDYDLSWLRRRVGIVLQDPYLFHGTIADNIRYAKADATDAEVIAAARAANAHDFVVNLPDGYDTTVGERGQSLSGGERQRVSIARAILHDPRILVLDEATSSVDTETEKQIQQALNRLTEGRTTFAIAHRLSTLTAADRLVVLDGGRIVETGTHSELVELEGGKYAKLHRTQVELNAAM